MTEDGTHPHPFLEVARDSRVVFDLTTLARWVPPPVGITRVEGQLGRWLRDNIAGVEFSFFDPEQNAFRSLTPEAVDRLLSDDPGVLWDMPRAGKRSAARRLDAALRLFRLRRLLLSRLERLRLSLKSPGGRQWIGKLQVSLMDADERRQLHTSDGRRRTIVHPGSLVGPCIRFGEDVLFVCVGAGWNMHGLGAVRSAVAAGARLCILCHDLIPIQFPADWNKRDAAALAAYLAFAFRHAHAVVFTSQAVRRDAAAWHADAADRLLRSPVVPLGADPVLAKPVAKTSFPNLEAGRFALLVGTVEPRKGHALMCACWRRLLAEGVPQSRNFRLVFAGRVGWQTEALVASLRSGEAGERIVFVEAPDDELLARLYADAAFCLFPSRYEGYGLPVVEAFAHGKPVLASRAGALVELVAALSPCLDPENEDEWLDWMRAWILDPRSYEPYARRIRDDFHHPTWPAAASLFFDSLADAARLPRHRDSELEPVGLENDDSRAQEPAADDPGTGAPTLGAPSVLVVITCRNYERFVAQAIRSVARQIYGNFRCVVVDDASDDASVATIRTALLELADPRFELLPLHRNVGQLAAFRVALHGRAGHLVAFLDADDYWFPEFLLTHVRAHLNTICAAPLSSSDAWLVDRDGTALEATFLALGKARHGAQNNQGINLPEDSCPAVGDGRVFAEGRTPPMAVRYMPRESTAWSWVNTSAMMFRRDFVDIAIPADGEPSRRHADYLLAYLGHMLGGSLIVPQALGVYRLHRRNLFANLPRIGSYQRIGVEPPDDVAHTHRCLVLQVLRNWHLFASMTSPEVLGDGLRRFMRWDRIAALGRANGVDTEAIATATKAARRARIRAKRKVDRPAAVIGDWALRLRSAFRGGPGPRTLPNRRPPIADSTGPASARKEGDPATPDPSGWAQILSASPVILLAMPTWGAPMGLAGVAAPLIADINAIILMGANWSFEVPENREVHMRAFREHMATHPRHRIIFMANTEKEACLVKEEGIATFFANHNCLVNDHVFKPLPGVIPQHDAICVARLTSDKRPELAADLPSLAFVYYHGSHSQSAADFHADHERLRNLMPGAVFVNPLTSTGCKRFNPGEVNAWLARSRVGLCLSPVEGAMFASIEYLFAGLSVVSTPSLGGRDVYFDDEFCIIADPDPRSIREAVEALVARGVPRDYVRAKTLAKVEADRARYVAFVQALIDEQGGSEPFQPRFRQLLYGSGMIPWRNFSEFSQKLANVSPTAGILRGHEPGAARR